VHASVSAETSNDSVEPLTSTIVRQQPLIAMLSPIATSATSRIADVERNAQAIAVTLRRGDPRHRLHDAGEHQPSLRTRAMIRRSSPIRATSTMPSGTRSDRLDKPLRHSAIPLAGSPMRKGAR
jgi:hypothetical protein